MTLSWENDVVQLPRCYILLKQDKSTPIREFLNDKHRIDIITYDDHAQMTDLLKDLSVSCPRTP